MGDADREVAHAFEIGIDLEAHHQQAKISGNRLIQSQQARDARIDIQLHLVDELLVFDDATGQAVIILDQGLDAGVNGRFDQAAHFKQRLI